MYILRKIPMKRNQMHKNQEHPLPLHKDQDYNLCIVHKNHKKHNLLYSLHLLLRHKDQDYSLHIVRRNLLKHNQIRN